MFIVSLITIIEVAFVFSKLTDQDNKQVVREVKEAIQIMINSPALNCNTV